MDELGSDNVVLICPECADERKANTQKNIEEKISKLLTDKIEKIWFKVKLTSGGKNEHVWIRVVDINQKDNIFLGTIDNNICFVEDKYSLGDEVIMVFGEIEEIYTE